jgi:hypothetical protein
MATSTLHQTLIEKASTKVAFVFEGYLLSKLLLREFKNSYKQALGFSFPIEGLTYINGSQKLQAKLISVKPNILDPMQENFKSSIEIDPSISNDPVIKIYDTFSLSLEIHKANEPDKVLFELTYEVSLFNSTINVTKGELELNNQIDFSINHISTDNPSLSQYRTECNITEEELLTLKGTLFYILPKKIVSSQFLGLSKIKLADIFTPFNTLGDFNLELIIDSMTPYIVLIMKDDISLEQALGCGINIGNISPSIFLGKEGWQIDYIPIRINPTDDDSNGIVMTYIPKVLFEKRFDKVAPAVNYTDSDNGFIGYDINVVVALKYVGLNFDKVRKCIVANVELYIWGSGHLSIDLGPCVGRMNLGDFEFHIGGLYERKNCSFDIILGFDFQESTNLYLKSYIENVQMGETSVTVELVSKYTGLVGGKTAIVGFITDIVLARILQHNIPIEIRHIIEKQGNLFNIKVMDLSKIEKVFKSKIRVEKQASYVTEREDKYLINYNELNEFGRLRQVCSSFDENSVLFGIKGYSQD